MSIAATQAVRYIEPRQPKPPPPVFTNHIWHVAANGSDANCGTNNAPFRTIQKAADAAQPGDSVLVAPGTYEGFRTVRSGKPREPILFKAQGEVVILANTNTPADHILVRSTDWIIIEGFTCREAPRAGISVLESSDVVISNNVCGPSGKWGIFSGFTPRIQILHNKAFGAREQHGIYVSNSRVPDDNPVLLGNESFENGGCGIQLNGDCTMGGDGLINGALLDGNIVHDNNSKGLSLISIEGSRIQNNVIYNNGHGSGAGGIHLAGEIGCDKPSQQNIVVNNTIVEPRIAALRLTDGSSRNVIFNNLIVGRGIADEVHDNRIDSDTNIRGDMPADYFVDPAAFDFRIGQNSRAAYAGKAYYAEKAAPTNDIAGVARSSNVPAVGAYDLIPVQR
jgi:hypothetical protein